MGPGWVFTKLLKSNSLITEFVITKFPCNITVEIIGFKRFRLQMIENMNQGELNRIYRTILFIKHLHLFSFNALVFITYLPTL
jgi:hypothetical protein